MIDLNAWAPAEVTDNADAGSKVLFRDYAADYVEKRCKVNNEPIQQTTKEKIPAVSARLSEPGSGQQAHGCHQACGYSPVVRQRARHQGWPRRKHSPACVRTAGRHHVARGQCAAGRFRHHVDQAQSSSRFRALPRSMCTRLRLMHRYRPSPIRCRRAWHWP